MEPKRSTTSKPNAETASPGLLALAEAIQRVRQPMAGEHRNAVRREFDSAPDGALFGDEVVAVVLDINPSTLATWRLAGRGPVWVRVGKAPKYRKADLLKFVEENIE